MQQPREEVENRTQTQLGQVQSQLESGTLEQVKRMLRALRPAEIASLLASSPPRYREILWELSSKKIRGEIIEELPVEIQSPFLKAMNTQDLVQLTENLESDDVVDILQTLPETVTQQVLSAMSAQDRERVESILNYDENTAGGLTNTDAITVRPRFTLEVVLRYIRRHSELPPSTDSLIVVDKKDHYLGLLPLSTLLTNDPGVTVRDIMETDRDPIHADMEDTDVAKLFERHDWVSAPVVDDKGKLLGRITIDDVVDVIRENADHSLMGLAGLDEEEDTFAPVKRTTPRRAIWLGVNLITAIIASSVINIFQDTIDKVVALAVLMPIVASMGGVAGSQTLTVVIRGMALGHIGSNNVNWLLSKELRVALINGIVWALVMGGVASLWFNDPNIAIILGAAMIINLLTAALAGAVIPLMLRSAGVDPALAGGVTLTTVTDVVGFFAFLGLATLFYA